MDEDLEKFLDGIKSQSFDLIRGELKTFLTKSKAQGDEFSRRQHLKINRYMIQMALGQITPTQLNDFMLGIKDEAEMEMRLGKVQAKASAQRIHDGVTNLVINGLIKAIPV